jgi:hypothetical protein
VILIPLRILASSLSLLIGLPYAYLLQSAMPINMLIIRPRLWP